MWREPGLKVVLILVGLLFGRHLSRRRWSIRSDAFRHGRHDDDGTLFRARYFPAPGTAQSTRRIAA